MSNLKSNAAEDKHMILQTPDKITTTIGFFLCSRYSCDLQFRFKKFPLFFHLIPSLPIWSYLRSSPCISSPVHPKTGNACNISHCIHFTFPQHVVIIKPFTSKHRLTSGVKLSFPPLLPRARSWSGADNWPTEFPLYV